VFPEEWKTNLLKTNLFMELAFIDVEFQGELLDRILENGNVFAVFFVLDHDLLDVPFLFAQDLDRFGVAVTLFVQFQIDIAHSGLQFVDDVLAADHGVHLDFFQADGQVLDRNPLRLLDGFVLEMRSCSSCEMSYVCFSSA
jgi:hypothetical protein